jgi:hypothetical protein
VERLLGQADLVRLTDQSLLARDGKNASEHRNRRTRIEAFHLDELPDLELVAEDEMALIFGERNEGGVGGIGDFDEEAAARAQVI